MFAKKSYFYLFIYLFFFYFFLFYFLFIYLFFFFYLLFFFDALTLSALGKNFDRRHFETFSLFFQKIGFDISYKLSPICMQCQSLFSEKKKKKEAYYQFAICGICPRMVKIKMRSTEIVLIFFFFLLRVIVVYVCVRVSTL